MVFNFLVSCYSSYLYFCFIFFFIFFCLVLLVFFFFFFFFFFSSRRRHTRCSRDWSSDVCSSDLALDRAASAPEDAARAELLQALDVGAQQRGHAVDGHLEAAPPLRVVRSEERRVGKECRSRWSAYHEKKKKKE